ncbi:MAG: lipid-binding SYLF domain-containing protein [Gammaproteobacteria bacterium]|nr:lipid-binding SYLF domain-containing protein [Gammaproteobacteria bacterium]
MINCNKMVLLILFMSVSVPHQAIALGEGISKLASDAGDLAKDIGNNIGDRVGIGATAAEIDHDTDIALKKLFKDSSAAVKLSKSARAILVYPKIIKAGLGVGGHHGKGALRKDNKTVAYYNTVAGSYGLQIGAQSFGYAMFFMDDKGLDYLIDNNKGWEVGVGPSLVFVDEGVAKTINNTTVNESVYVFTFNQHGLMAGAGIQGSKITKINLDS